MYGRTAIFDILVEDLAQLQLGAYRVNSGPVHVRSEEHKSFVEVAPASAKGAESFPSSSGEWLAGTSSSASSVEDTTMYEELFPIYREDEIRYMRPLGEGGNAFVDLVQYDGQMMVMKTPLNGHRIGVLSHEINIQHKLAGAGGAPLIHGLTLHPPRMFMSYTGVTFDKFIEDCSQLQLINSLIIIAQKLQEIHDQGIVHNDLKTNNITVSDPDTLDLHIIDFGLSREVGDVLCISNDGEGCSWYAPEVRARDPVSPATDVFSFGDVISNVLHAVEDDDVWILLSELESEAMSLLPIDRPSLGTVIAKLQDIAKLLPC